MKGEVILCISTRMWNSLWRSTQQIMSRMAIENTVLFLEPGRDPDRDAITEILRNLPHAFQLSVRNVQDHLFVIRTGSNLPHARAHLPRTVLKTSLPLVVRLNALITAQQVYRAIKAFSVRAPILWLYSPYHVDLVGKFGEKLACYFVYDEVADFAPNARVRDFIREMDEQLARRVDLVFASSQIQSVRREKINPNSYFIPNGVDFDQFNAALRQNGRPPADVADLPRPVIGFSGWIGYQIDVPLLCYVATTFSDCSFVLVGPELLPPSAERDRLKSLPNVYFLGQKDRNELPNYVRAFDVALIPRLLTGHGGSSYPLKLHEYLAAGRSVVATAIPALNSYSDVVRIAKTPHEFVRHIAGALNDYAPAQIEARVAVARDNTWDHRVAEINGHLDNHIALAERRRSHLQAQRSLAS